MLVSHWSVDHATEEVNLHTFRKERSSGQFRPVLRIVPVIVANNDSARGSVGNLFNHICSESLCRSVRSTSSRVHSLSCRTCEA